MNSEKVITLVSRGLGIGGAQKNLIFLANTLADEGFKVHLISISSKKSSMYVDNRVVIHNLGYEWIDFKNMHFFRRRIRELKIILSIRKTIKLINPDVVIAFIEDIINYTYLACKFMNVRLVFSERD